MGCVEGQEVTFKGGKKGVPENFGKLEARSVSEIGRNVTSCSRNAFFRSVRFLDLHSVILTVFVIHVYKKKKRACSHSGS